MPARPLPPLRVLFAAVLLAAAPACQQRELVPTGLPPELAVRSDTPYVRGTIIAREEGAAGTVRVRVRDRRNSDWRVTEAIVTVGPDAMLRWADGRVAVPAELTVGRAVMVFSTGPELRSLPPQVSAAAVLVGRDR